MIRSFYVGVMTAILALNLGCGSCQVVQENRDEFLAQRQLQEADRGHHVLVSIPKRLFENGVDRAFGAIPDMPVALTGFGAVGQYVDGLSLRPKELAFDFDRSSNLKLGLNLDAFYGRSRLFGIQLKAVVPVIYDRKTQTMTLVVRYDVFEQVEPSLSRGAADNLTRAIRSKIPSLARQLVSTNTLRGYVQKNLSRLLRDFYPVVRQTMLKPMGEIVRFKFKVPDLPVERITLISSQNDLVFGIRTSLKAKGLPTPKRVVNTRTVRFSISTDMVASLGNQAIDDGRIPAQYNANGRPTSDGAYTAGFAWTRTNHPLKVKLWNLEPKTLPACIYVQAGARPTVSLKGKKLKFGFRDGRIEEVLGPPLISEALDVLGISKRVFSLT
ncbi:MAG: hypothetical protein VYA30_07795 [Myxococcota bacterium]|nr:hypothetical protein [Myxococcota bacterium]